MDNLQEVYHKIYEQEQLDEISVETIKSASDQAGRLSGQAAALGAPGYAKKKREQQERLFAAQAERRLTPKVKTAKITREEADIFDYVLEYLITEGYADTNENAIAIMANMSDEQFEDLLERKYDFDEPLPGSGKTPRQKAQKKIDNHLTQASKNWSNRGGTSNPRKTSSYKERYHKASAIVSSIDRGEDPRNDSVQGDQRKIYTNQYGSETNAKTVDNARSAYTSGGLRAHQTKAGGYRKLTRKEEFEAIVEFLFVEGYADTIERAEVMVESISEQWANEILDEKHVKAMDTKGADHRASNLGKVPKRRKPTPDKYKHSEGDFSPRDLSPGARRRRDERRQGVGGFSEAKVDSHLNADNPEQRLRDRNERNVDPSIPVGYRTASRRSRHELSRGKKQSKGLKTNYDNLGNMNRSRYREQQFKRTGNDLYKE